MNKKNLSVNKEINGVIHRICIKCKVLKPLLSDFYKSGTHHSTSCKSCKNASKRVWYDKNKDHVKATVKTWYENRKDDPIIRESTRERCRRWYRDNIDYIKVYRKINSDKQYVRKLGSEYSLTPEEYMFLLEKCGNKCEMCGVTSQKEENKRLNIDHCHKTGKVRGLLCGSCNRALGLLKDSKHILYSGYMYLHRSMKVD